VQWGSSDIGRGAEVLSSLLLGGKVTGMSPGTSCSLPELPCRANAGLSLAVVESSLHRSFHSELMGLNQGGGPRPLVQDHARVVEWLPLPHCSLPASSLAVHFL
jgi:hypothetical protein